MPASCEVVVGELIAQTSPASILWIARDPPERLLNRCTQLPGGRLSSLEPSAAETLSGEFGRFDLAVIWDGLGQLPKASGERLIGRLRDLHAARLVVLAEIGSEWQETDLLSLGLVRLARCPGAQSDLRLYGYDIATYKATPDWLNPRFWAHPERWDKDWW